MSAVPSFERFDYVLRTNKHIERKLIFDVLQSAAQMFPMGGHWYLGFGSMWFGDFRIAHRTLVLKDMLSLEHAEYAARANFNKPFSGVSVVGGESTDVLSNHVGPRWQRPLIAWLDYDKELNAVVVADMRAFLQHALPNSVLIVTVNGMRATYRVRKPKGDNSREETSVGVVESFLGTSSTPAKFVPVTNDAGVAKDVKESEFPEYLAEAILTYMQHSVTQSARTVDDERLQFVPLYSLSHKDGADMVTVGGALCKESEVPAWKECLGKHPLISSNDGNVSYCRLDLIPLTLKEKIVLDSCLPIPESDAAFLDVAKASGLKISDDEMYKYRKFYRHFPVFVESSV